MKNRISVVLGFALLICVIKVNAVTIETVAIDHIGNAPDPATGSLYGSVNYKYKIGKFEVTNSQYMEFLNAVATNDVYGLYNTNMFANSAGGIQRFGDEGAYTYAVVSGRGNCPVNFVTFSNMLYFANWLTNGQGGPETIHNGAYDLSQKIETLTRSSLRPAWFLTSEDEWYKAAYYDPTLNSNTGGYWLYATKNNTQPVASAPPGSGNNSNWNRVQTKPTIAGAYVGSVSYYGLHDLAGNVSEVTDTIYDITTFTNRIRRGQNYRATAVTLLPSSGRTIDGLTAGAVNTLGFRVVHVLRTGTLMCVK